MESAGGDSRSGFEAVTDEFSGAAGGGDDFSVDELLDFSNGYSETEEQQMEEQRETEKGKVKVKTTPLFREREGAVSLSKREDIGSFHDGELCFQAEGLESLEWVSHFMDDSFPDYSLAGKLPAAEPQPCFTTPVQTKARTKRARAGLRVWHVLSSTEHSASPPSSTSSTTSFPLENAPAKKKKKSADGQPRRCSHCGVTKTPQWRAGPLGSKTLCNACGVRYKSGRLLPEYRPACSPTFSTEMHSNNHRKVLEMRRKKETEVQTTGLPPPVQSF
ncbi:GATA transcription factor 5-like [Salvia miltiorrhiza]|uniref:GATA transcription factor 5-like n=1 Tax=Salvia miltiorrhiza TaxID=226208 RepID=UPI0025AD0547|nr:GATA transcription factor 5-like [Salvia miltiorrhiza]XP_057766141.1 GATA transcription factor 5-like [Salvia miltiorrhiza]